MKLGMLFESYRGRSLFYIDKVHSDALDSNADAVHLLGEGYHYV